MTIEQYEAIKQHDEKEAQTQREIFLIEQFISSDFKVPEFKELFEKLPIEEAKQAVAKRLQKEFEAI